MTKLPTITQDCFLNDGTFGKYEVLDLKTKKTYKAVLSGQIGQYSDCLRIDADINTDNAKVFLIENNVRTAIIKGNFGITTT